MIVNYDRKTFIVQATGLTVKLVFLQLGLSIYNFNFLHDCDYTTSNIYNYHRQHINRFDSHPFLQAWIINFRYWKLGVLDLDSNLKETKLNF
jgi:hypothetical protein